MRKLNESKMLKKNTSRKNEKHIRASSSYIFSSLTGPKVFIVPFGNQKNSFKLSESVRYM